MDSKVKLYIERADNKLVIAKTNFDISVNINYKKFLNIPIEKTFFNEVISESYYAIFYAAKSYLLSKNIKTEAPEEHKKTLEEFKKFVVSGKLNKELLDIYEAETTKAETLLNIFFTEKRKRGLFTYNVKSSANIPYAQESLANSRKFVSMMRAIIQL